MDEYKKCDGCGYSIWENQRAFRFGEHILCEKCLHKTTKPYVVCNFCGKMIHMDAICCYKNNYYHFGCLKKLLEIRKDDED